MKKNKQVWFYTRIDFNKQNRIKNNLLPNFSPLNEEREIGIRTKQTL